MIAQARRRAATEGVADRCRFQVQDLSNLDVGETIRPGVGRHRAAAHSRSRSAARGARGDDCAPRAGRTDDSARGCTDRGRESLRLDGVQGAPSRRLSGHDPRLRSRAACADRRRSGAVQNAAVAVRAQIARGRLSLSPAWRSRPRCRCPSTRSSDAAPSSAPGMPCLSWKKDRGIMHHGH